MSTVPKGVLIFQSSFVEGVGMPGLRPGDEARVQTSVSVSRSPYDLFLAKVDGMPTIAIVHRESALAVYVPMANVRSFVLMTEEHEALLTDPKKGDRKVGLVAKLG